MAFLEPLYEQLNSMGVGFIKLLPVLGIAVFVLLMTWAVAKIAAKLLRVSLSHSKIRPSLKELFGSLLKVGIWTVGLLISAAIVFPSLTPAKMLAALGLGSVAIGFAFKDIFENFLAGILIMLREPMRIGDYIDCDGVEGKVEHITIRDTYVRQTNGELILVPNSHLFQNPLNVETDEKYRRYELTVGVAYDEDVDKCRDIIRKAVESVELVNKNKPVQVFACEFNSSSIDYNVRWWSESKPIDKHQSRDQIIAAIKKALDEAGVEIPFPYRTLTFKEPLNISQAAQDEQDGNKKSKAA